MPFSEHPEGLEILKNLSSNGIKSAEQIQNFLRNLKTVEKEYTAGLVNLALSAGGVNAYELGSVAIAWNSLIEYVLGVASDHEVIASSLDKIIVDPVMQDFKEREKLLHDEAHKHVEIKAIAMKKLEEATRAHDQLLVENDNAKAEVQKYAAKEKKSEKDLEKLQKKFDGVNERARMSEFDMEGEEAEGLKAIRQYNANLGAVLDKWEKFERSRSEFVTECLTKTTEFLGVQTSTAKALAELTGNVAKIDLEGDYEEFILKMVGEVVTMRSLPVSKKDKLMVKRESDARFEQMFCVLAADHGSVYCFKNEAAVYPVGRVPIPAGLKTVEIADTSLFNDPLVLRINLSHENVFFRCPSRALLDTWWSQLQTIASEEVMARRDQLGCQVCSLTLGVAEAKGPAFKKGDYHAAVHLNGALASITPVACGTVEPFWGETYFFDDLLDSNKLSIVVAKSTKKDTRTVGKFDLELSDKRVKEEKWRELRSEDGGEAGTIRVSVNYVNEVIHPFHVYEPMTKILDSELNILFVLSLVVPASKREEVAKHLLGVYHGQGRMLEVVFRMVEAEIDCMESASVIFRGNSLASKMIDLFMKDVGMGYLHSTIEHVVTRMFDSKIPCEVDPTRASESEVKAAWPELQKWMMQLWKAVLGAATFCPGPMRAVFAKIRDCVTAKWPEDETTKYIAVSGFLFLRFFVPAVLNPKLFGIVAEHPKGSAARTLTLVAKTLQNLGNLVEFGQKEPYMAPMNSFITENMPKMKSYLDIVSRPQKKDGDVVTPRPSKARHASGLFSILADSQADLKSVLSEGAKDEQLNKDLQKYIGSTVKESAAALFEVLTDIGSLGIPSAPKDEQDNDADRDDVAEWTSTTIEEKKKRFGKGKKFAGGRSAPQSPQPARQRLQTTVSRARSRTEKPEDKPADKKKEEAEKEKKEETEKEKEKEKEKEEEEVKEEKTGADAMKQPKAEDTKAPSTASDAKEEEKKEQAQATEEEKREEGEEEKKRESAGEKEEDPGLEAATVEDAEAGLADALAGLDDLDNLMDMIDTDVAAEVPKHKVMTDAEEREKARVAAENKKSKEKAALREERKAAKLREAEEEKDKAKEKELSDAKAQGREAKASFEYEASNVQEVSVEAGEALLIISEVDGWFKVATKGGGPGCAIGLLPGIIVDLGA